MTVSRAGARVTNPASRRILEKCGFQWTGVGLCRIRALNSSAPIDRFRLDRGLWTSLRSLERCQARVLTLDTIVFRMRARPLRHAD